jgi:hypothetical protein
MDIIRVVYGECVECGRIVGSSATRYEDMAEEILSMVRRWAMVRGLK